MDGSRFEESVMEKTLEQNPEDSVHVATAEIEDKDPEDSEDSSHVDTEIENISDKEPEDSSHVDAVIENISDKEPEDSSHVDAVIDREEPEDNDEEERCDADTEIDSSENELDGIIQEEESDVDVTNSGTISDILFYGEENVDHQLPECVRELESIVETNEVEIRELQLQLDVLEDNYYNVLQENVSLKVLVESLQTRVNSLEGFQLQEGISTQCYSQTKSNCGVEIIKNDDKATCFYTGIPKYFQFLKLFDLL